MTITVRTTFGIIDPTTRRKYSDILSAFIVHDTLTSDILSYENPYYVHDNRVYLLDIDNDLFNRIRDKGEHDAIISLQHRKGYDIAIARRPSRDTKRMRKVNGGVYDRKKA